MPRWRMTLLRYNVIVAAVYFAVFLTIGVLSGGLNHRLTELLLMSFMGAGAGVLVTMAAVARFGDLGGSKYFVATAIHVGIVCTVAFVVVIHLP
jgi:hypothetical protein